LQHAAASVGLMAILLAPAGASLAAGTATLVLRTDSGPHNFNVELATTESTRRIGLMYRRSLPDDAGMLFLYDTPRPISMWMRNTFLPLDMIFIDADGKVHRIEERTEPFSEEPIFSGGPVQGVLEVKAGTAETIGLKPGDTVVLPKLEATPDP
jgi:uncharacterized membrane protein (UPF0127 family)